MTEKKSERNAAIECLRVVVMLFIVLHHCVVSVNGLNLHDSLTNNLGLSGRTLILTGLNAFVIVGVNVFFLISGYFKINFSVKKLLRLFGELVFYSFAIYLVFIILGLATFSVSDVLRFTILAINDHWFVICYFILMLLSPYLNMFIEEISKDKKKYGILLLILFLVLCVYGFVFSIPWIGVYDGYSLLYAVFLYLVGSYIRVSGIADKGKAGYTFLIYGACALLNWGLVNICIITKHGWFAWHLYSYNNPLILVESIALLTLFLKWKQVGSLGKKIAMLGKYTFGIYLLHTHQLVLKYRFAPLKSITEGKHWTFWALSILVYCLVLYAGCMLIEILRSLLTDFIRKRLNPAK